MSTAFSGTRTERNTIISSRKDISSTPPKKSGSRSAVPRVESTLAATMPPTWTVRPVPAVAAGIASSRRRSTRSSVAASWGDVVGVSGEHRGVARPRSRSRGRRGPRRPTSAQRRPRAASAAPWRSPDAPWTVSTIGAEKPGPNPSASRS